MNAIPVYIIVNANIVPNLVEGNSSPNPIQNIVLKVNHNAFYILTILMLVLNSAILKQCVRTTSHIVMIVISFKL
jgi:hypothetical protein